MDSQTENYNYCIIDDTLHDRNLLTFIDVRISWAEMIVNAG